jgi:phenylacetate-CoA ligase
MPGSSRLAPIRNGIYTRAVVSALGAAYGFYRSLILESKAVRWPASAAEVQRRVWLPRIVRHAYRNVPFYKSHFDRAGVRPDEIRRPEDLWRIPPISKQDLIAAGKLAIDSRRTPERLIVGSTGGTTGARFYLHSTLEELADLGGYMWSAWVAAGVRPTDRILTLESRHLRHTPPPWRGFRILHEDGLDRRAELFRSIRPTVVIGHTEAMVVLAREVLRRELAKESRVRLAFPFGWTLTPDARATIRSAFGVDPIDCYGTTETTWVGVQCEARDGFHIPHHRLIVQSVEPAGSSKVGELVLTDLRRQVMPFIRYRIADVGRVTHAPCRCGRPGPRIVDFLGRSLSLLIGRDGRPRGPGNLKLWLAHERGVFADFRVIQESPERIVLEYVVGADWSEPEMQEVRLRFAQVLGDVHLVERRVAEIPKSPSAKFSRVMRTFDIPGGDALDRATDQR